MDVEVSEPTGFRRLMLSALATFVLVMGTLAALAGA
jgi:hypothetical protein